MLEIKNLHVEVGGKTILNGIDLTVNAGEVHAIMGPNGSGKSTLSYVLAGKEEYEVTEGEVLYNGENLLEMEPDERAVAGVFLAFQYPVEIPGVGTMTFLRTALNAQRKARGEEELTTPGLHEAREGRVRQAADHAGHAEAAAQCRLLRRREEAERDFADGAAAAEALRHGRDRFRPRHRRAPRSSPTASTRSASPERSFVVITHYQRLLNYIVPDFVHVMSKGRIVRSGGKELALELEERGYADYASEAA